MRQPERDDDVATSALTQERVLLHCTLYPEDCVRAAGDAYKMFAAISVEGGDQSSTITVVPVPGAPDLVTLRREFLNHVLDLSIRKRLAS
jgi:hypothetical protein